jgi:hypothetical protein
MKYDHFHAEWEKGDESGEIEGGWTAGSERAERNGGDWIYKMCVAWGMPEGATVHRFWLAG